MFTHSHTTVQRAFTPQLHAKTDQLLSPKLATQQSTKNEALLCSSIRGLFSIYSASSSLRSLSLLNHLQGPSTCEYEHQAPGSDGLGDTNYEDTLQFLSRWQGQTRHSTALQFTKTQATICAQIDRAETSLKFEQNFQGEHRPDRGHKCHWLASTWSGRRF